MQDFNPCGELSGFLIELAEASDLPSQPPVVKVANVALQVHEVAAWPNKEGTEPGREQFDGVFFTMPNRVSLRIQVDNVRGLIRALLLMEPGDSTIFQLFDPFCWFEDPVAKGDEEVRDSPIILNIPVGGAFEYVFIVLDTIVESANLFLEATDFDVLLGIVSSDGCEEPFGDGSEDVGIEVRVRCQRGCNGTGQHRWFRTLDRASQERNAVFDG
jgi:hypothetical protein